MEKKYDRISFSSQENGNKSGIHLLYTISSLVCLYVFRGLKARMTCPPPPVLYLGIRTNIPEKKLYITNKPQVYCHFPVRKMMKNRTTSLYIILWRSWYVNDEGVSCWM